MAAFGSGWEEAPPLNLKEGFAERRTSQDAQHAWVYNKLRGGEKSWPVASRPHGDTTKIGWHLIGVPREEGSVLLLVEKSRTFSDEAPAALSTSLTREEIQSRIEKLLITHGSLWVQDVGTASRSFQYDPANRVNKGIWRHPSER